MQLAAFTHLEAARSQLAAARESLSREISNYPTPIAGCDAQFNHLIATRRKIGSALAALEFDEHIPTPRAL